jgi:tRNA(Ile)-lysidine synthase
MEQEIITKVKKAISKFGLIKNGDRILIGVSGGADSMTLLTILNTIKNELNLEIGVATFNHKIRPSSYEETQIVKNYAETLGVPFYYGEGDAVELSKKNKKNLEEAARELRFHFLSETKAKYGYNKIAIAHNLNDFVETFLMHLMKGSGLKGVTSLIRVEMDIIHPLIYVKRQEIELYAKENSIPYVVDYSNFDLSYERNRIRYQIYPLLSSIYPEFETHIMNLAEILLSEDQFMEKIASTEFNCIKNEEEFSLMLFNNLPVALKRRILKAMLQDAGSFKKIEETITFLESDTKKLNVAKDLYIIKNDKTFRFEKETPFTIDTVYTVNLNGETIIKEANIKLIVSIIDKGEFVDFKQKDVAYFDFEKISFPLYVRFRREGDYIELDFGKKKLQDLFVDEKITRSKRFRIPILTDSKDHILWVVGLKRSKLAKVTENTSKILQIKSIPINVNL